MYFDRNPNRAFVSKSRWGLGARLSVVQEMSGNRQWTYTDFTGKEGVWN